MNFLHKVKSRVEDLFGSSSSGRRPDGHGSSGGSSFLSSVGHFFENPKEAIYQARLGVEGRQEEVLGDAHQVSNQDIVMEQLAHAGAYGKLDNDKLAHWGYREAGAVEDPESGFRAVLYVPTGAPRDTEEGATARAIHGGAAPPVLSFRGTANKRGVADDANREGIGTYQFSSNVSKIQALMQAAGGKCVVTGHSLGGALAQMAAASFPGGVQSIVTFQSPGVNKETADKLKEYNEQARPEDRIRSTHHRAEGDLVPMAGEALTEGDVYTYESVGVANALDHSRFPLARLAAARGNLIPGINDDQTQPPADRLVRVVHTTTGEEKSGLLPKLSEGVRKVVGGLVRDDKMESYVDMWTDVKEMAKTGQFSPSYVRGVIHDSDRLTDVQKIKMRDQFAGLYD